MKRVILGILVYSLMTSMIYAASSKEVCELLKQSIQKRSFEDFQQKLSLVNQLHDDCIAELIQTCATYLKALDIICEVQENPQIKDELQKIADERDEFVTCLQMIRNLFPNHARARARELSNLTYNTPLGSVVQDIISELVFFVTEDDKYKTVRLDRFELMDINCILKQKQNRGEVKEGCSDYLR